MQGRAIQEYLEHYFKEDDLGDNLFYNQALPSDLVECELKFKSDMIVAGIPFFFQVFEYLGFSIEKNIQTKAMGFEGQWIKKESLTSIKFEAPFSVALNAERVALNLLSHCSKIATYTRLFVDKASEYNIAIIDTRKTTPGLRAFEKYAVRVGGGFNHRFGQTDVWMVKDNHKNYFGSLTKAVEFFRSMQGFYQPLIVEIHNLAELDEAKSIDVKHVMLDNFTPVMLKQAIDQKPDGMSYEVSGGISFDELSTYLMRGIDALSIGRLTYGAPPVDVSLKMKRISLC
jgi:nicotinate-nucleotide pyrophosphorylase (carboxylating)